MKSAPMVKSLVALHRDKCSIESSDSGTYLKLSCMARVKGEAIAFFRATMPSQQQQLVDPTADGVCRQHFDAGNAQPLEFRLCASSLRKGLEGFRDADNSHQLVVDLRADSADANAVTVQRSIFKLNSDSDTPQVSAHKQMVQCGRVVRNLEALYGTL